MSNKIILKRSSVITDNGNAKLPTADLLEYGELAINFAKDVETISMKNNQNEIVEFKTKNYFENIIKENEETVSNSLNDLNAKIESKLDASSLNGYAKTTDLESHIEKIASVSEAGHIKIGTTVNDAAAGNHNHDASYAPKNEVNTITNTINNHIDTKSSTSRLGHVKVGDFLSADENGTLSVKTGTSEDTVAVGNHTHDNYSSLMHNHGKLILSGDVTGETTITSGTDDMTMDVTINGYEHNHDDLYYTETEIDNKLNNKQDIISDLEAIRSGAELGATALQSVPAEYVTETELNNKGYLTQHQSISHLATKEELTGYTTDAEFITLSNTVSDKQDKINDLETIRSGAALGATALQAVPEEYVTATELEGKGYLTANDFEFANNNDIDSLFGVEA